MFQQTGEQGYSFGSWLGQLLLASVVPLLLWAGLSGVLHLQDTLLPQLACYLFLAGTSIGLALGVSRINRETLKSGSWIFVLPLMVELWLFHSAMSSTVPLRNMFIVPGPGRGEEGWGVLITLPKWSCCWYAAACARLARLLPASPIEKAPTPARTASSTAIPSGTRPDSPH